MDFNPSRFGQINQSGDTLALFLKMFGGEVLTAFSETNVALSRHMVRSIESGKSASFPASWKGDASYHTPGKELTGQSIGHAERIINIDDLLVADRAIASIDEAMNHYDVRSIYSRDIGMALARRFDKNVLAVIGLTARASATVNGANGGTVITDANSKTVAANLEADAFAVAQAFDEKDVPENDRYFGLKPQQYYLLVSGSAKVLNRDYNPTPNGGYAKGKVFEIAGLEIVKTNNLPSTNITTGPSAYQGNFSTTAAVAWQRGAAGTVKLIDLAVEQEYSVRHQSTLLVGKYAVGHGILRPECSAEVKTA